MKKLALLALLVVLGMTSCTAQFHSGSRRNYPPQRQRPNTHQQRPPHNQRPNVQVRVNVPAVCPVYNRSQVFRKIIIANKMYNPRWGGNPNLWAYENPNSPYWPWRESRKPYKFYYTDYSTVYYTSTNILMGVNLDRQILVTKDGSKVSVYQNGKHISTTGLHHGYHYTLEVRTSYGWRLVEIFYNGSCHVNYMDINGDVLESYELF